MSTNTPHGAQGCPCEDCLGARIQLTADLAITGRRVAPLWARQRRFRARVVSDEMLRRAS
jgi:hypothetical protein